MGRPASLTPPTGIPLGTLKAPPRGGDNGCPALTFPPLPGLLLCRLGRNWGGTVSTRPSFQGPLKTAPCLTEPGQSSCQGGKEPTHTAESDP